MLYLTNAFSLNMLASVPASIQVDALDVESARALAQDATSVVGHQDTAAVFGAELGMPVLFNRVSVALNNGDELVVGQYVGPRLPEGASVLPEGATIKWLKVSIS